ncbi:hypothetical protein [Pandoraea apista]|uniref:hypothetical protein n=1 Tax=Pandoraea apista TaxID=93218 RepID=UPI00065836C0|nr:hypothetical protein [Pandoraea apista]ALS65545.1 hypothetical protein AT395_11610 [Pandoraea apista]RRW90669.1 hypothetical protein EGJ54_22225 [Pandoraea apista]RRX00459.1 hypothetical protein EGJ56_19470 [Pandoraea apista]CFB62671.1 hypothetical protein LMG16407_02744 [Pandoraea apista]
MARSSGDLKAHEAVAALAALAKRREAGLRASLVRMTAAARDAAQAVAESEEACETRRQAWRTALSRGGVYAQREVDGATRSVEAARAALGEAKTRHGAALEQVKQADAALQQQRERLQANARKQEKLKALLALYRR